MMQPYVEVDPAHAALFEAIWAVLVGPAGGTDDSATRWLNTPNVRLDERTPIELINEGHGYRVRNVAYLLVD